MSCATSIGGGQRTALRCGLLVADLVRHALGPAIAGRTAAQVEGLRVVDPACGSAHFLVEAMRFLGQALHRAYSEEHDGKAPPHFRSTMGQAWDVDWRAPDEEARAANSEARAWCKRRIAERCLFGVDQNPTAVTLARVALWIESVAGDRPLTYFEHHIRHGNSLLGSFLDRLDQPPFEVEEESRLQKGLFAEEVRRAVAEAARLRTLIDRARPEDLLREGIEPDSVAEQEFKDGLRAQADGVLRGARLLFGLRSASLFLPVIWRDWWGLADFVADADLLEREARKREWWPDFERVREREAFFHWELEFPEVFLDGESGGFDAVLGNPPWDKVLPAKHDFYARADPLIRAFKGADLDRRIAELEAARQGLAEDFAAYQDRTKRIARFLHKGGDFPLSEARSAAAHEDVSKYFVDRAARLVHQGGAVGFLVPSVVYNGDGCVGVRRFLLEECAIERFYGFENRWKLFPIDSRYKFVCLVFRKGTPTEAFNAAFMRHDPEELAEVGPKPWMVRVTSGEIGSHSPETLAFLEYRSSRDQEIVRKMEWGKPRLGDRSEPGNWGSAFLSDQGHIQIYNTARDKDLWTDPKNQVLYSPEQVLADHVNLTNNSEMLTRMRECGFWPVFEGKNIDQFLTATKPIRWWLSVERAEHKHRKAPRRLPLLSFRDTASNTNERTCIAAVLPPHSGATETLAGLLVENVDADSAASVLNSLSFDFLLRLRTAGTHVSFTYMRPMPVPPADVANRLPRIPTQLAWEAGTKHITNKKDLWPLLWEANRAVAEAYGLSADDFEHVMASFPVFARKRPAFFAYLAERLKDWKAEAGRS